MIWCKNKNFEAFGRGLGRLLGGSGEGFGTVLGGSGSLLGVVGDSQVYRVIFFEIFGVFSVVCCFLIVFCCFLLFLIAF